MSGGDEPGAVGEGEGLARLQRDLQQPDLPAPELLARYAREPNRLDPEERAEVERAMAMSPAVADELDTLRHFDFAALNADLKEGAAVGGWLARLRGTFGGRPEIWAVVAAALVLVFWLVRPDLADRASDDSAPQFVQQDSPRAPSDPSPSPLPERDPSGLAAPPQVEDLEESLAMRPGPTPDAPPPAPSPRPEPALSPPDTLPETPLYASDDASPIASPDAAPTAPPDPIDVDPNDSLVEREMLLAMNMPDYRPAYAADDLGIADWLVRSGDADSIGVVVVAPDHVTRTSRVSPTLHWSLARRPEAGAFYLTILYDDDEEQEPIRLDHPVPMPKGPGLQRLDLAALGIGLPRGRALRWSVAFRSEAEAPPSSFDFGWIRVDEADPELAERLAAATPGERVAVFADAGCYHEALDAALGLAEAAPGPNVERAIARLLEQAGVGELAAARAAKP